MAGVASIAWLRKGGIGVVKRIGANNYIIVKIIFYRKTSLYLH